MTVDDDVEELNSSGFVRIAGPFPTAYEADQVSSALVEACRVGNELPPLSVIGSFVLAPPGSGDTRDFQTLHFDFGLPLDPKLEQEVAGIRPSTFQPKLRGSARLLGSCH